MPRCSSHRWRPLLLSLLLSLGMHIGLLAALCAFPSNSPPQLRLQQGDLCFNVHLVSLGEPSLGSGYSDAGDGSGDGLPAVASWTSMVRPETASAESAPSDAVAATPQDSSADVEEDDAAPAPAASDTPMPEAAEPAPADATASPPNVMPTDTAVFEPAPLPTPPAAADRPAAGRDTDSDDASPAPTAPDATTNEESKRAASAVDRTDERTRDAPQRAASASSEPARGTGQPAGASTTGGAVGVRSGVRFSGQRPPNYPVEAQRRGIEGEVMLWLKVSADGTVAEARLRRSSGHELLDAAAIRWARSLRFVPARNDGKPVSTEVLLPVRYRLVDAITQ